MSKKNRECDIQNFLKMTKIVNKLKLPVQTEKPLKNSFDSDSLTSIFSPWQKHREPPIYSNAQTGRTVSASEFYLFYVSILLLILGLSLSAISVWSIFFKMPFKLLIDTSSELAYFALPSAILCLPCFWIVLSVHNDGKSHKFLSLVIILLTFSIVLMVIGVYIGSTHKLHLKLSEIERRPVLLNEFRNSMKGSLKLYEKYKGNKRVWDQVQANFGCCGIDNFTDWFPVNKRIPTSCCHKVTCRDNSTSSDGCLKIVTATLALQTCLFNGINCVALFIQCCAFVAIASIYFYGKNGELD